MGWAWLLSSKLWAGLAIAGVLAYVGFVFYDRGQLQQDVATLTDERDAARARADEWKTARDDALAAKQDWEDAVDQMQGALNDCTKTRDTVRDQNRAAEATIAGLRSDVTKARADAAQRREAARTDPTCGCADIAICPAMR